MEENEVESFQNETPSHPKKPMKKKGLIDIMNEFKELVTSKRKLYLHLKLKVLYTVACILTLLNVLGS